MLGWRAAADDCDMIVLPECYEAPFLCVGPVMLLVRPGKRRGGVWQVQVSLQGAVPERCAGANACSSWLGDKYRSEQDYNFRAQDPYLITRWLLLQMYLAGRIAAMS